MLTLPNRLIEAQSCASKGAKFSSSMNGFRGGVTSESFVSHGCHPEVKFHRFCLLRMSQGRDVLSRRDSKSFFPPVQIRNESTECLKCFGATQEPLLSNTRISFMLKRNSIFTPVPEYHLQGICDTFRG